MDHLPLPVGELDWSSWLSVLPPTNANEIPEKSGLWKLSHTKLSGIHFVGYAKSDTVRYRVKRLAYELRKNEMPFTTPVSAGPCLWAMKQEVGGNFFVSWVTDIPSEKVETLCDAYLTSYAITTSQFPTANFGRMFSGYSKSSSNTTGIRGEKGDRTERDSPISFSIADAVNISDVKATDWLGLDWSDPQKYSIEKFGGLSYSYPSKPGVVRTWKEGEEELQSVGVGRDVAQLLSDNIPDNHTDIRISYSQLDFDGYTETEELKTILSGAHYLATSSNLTVVDEGLEERIEDGENERTEFKEQIPEQVDDIVREVVALANTNGGQLIIGVTDRGQVDGLDDPKSTLERVSGVLRSAEKRLPVEISEEIVEGEPIVVVDVESAVDYPYSYEGVFHVRDGPDRDRMRREDLKDWL